MSTKSNNTLDLWNSNFKYETNICGIQIANSKTQSSKKISLLYQSCWQASKMHKTVSFEHGRNHHSYAPSVNYKDSTLTLRHLSRRLLHSNGVACNRWAHAMDVLHNATRMPSNPSVRLLSSEAWLHSAHKPGGVPFGAGDGGLWALLRTLSLEHSTMQYCGHDRSVETSSCTDYDSSGDGDAYLNHTAGRVSFSAVMCTSRDTHASSHSCPTSGICYGICGGTGALGSLMAIWIAGSVRGVNIVMTGRRGRHSDGGTHSSKSLEYALLMSPHSTSCISIVSCDVSATADVQAVQHDLPRPLDNWMHASGVLNDAQHIIHRCLY